MPPELFEEIRLFGNLVQSPFFLKDDKRPWSRRSLERFAQGRSIIEGHSTSPECQAHYRKLLGILDGHEAEVKAVWSEHDRLDDLHDREATSHWDLLERIIGTKVETLQGASAQLKVIETDGFLTDAEHPSANARIVKMMRNMRRLIAQQAGSSHG